MQRRRHLFRPMLCWRYVQVLCLLCIFFLHACVSIFALLILHTHLMQCNTDDIPNSDIWHTIQKWIKLVFYPISFPIIPFTILFYPYIHTISPLTHPVNWGVTSPYLRTQDPLGPVFEEFLEADQRLGQVRTKITGQSGRWNLIKQIGV